MALCASFQAAMSARLVRGLLFVARESPAGNVQSGSHSPYATARRAVYTLSWLCDSGVVDGWPKPYGFAIEAMPGMDWLFFSCC